MAHYTDAVFNIAWPNAVKFNGDTFPIADLCKSGVAFLAYAGSSAEGWAIYLVDDNDKSKKQQVSPLFCKDFGDTRRDMMQACARAYGVENNPIVNLGQIHPEEAFHWRTA